MGKKGRLAGALLVLAFAAVSCGPKIFNFYEGHCGLYYKDAAKMREQQDSIAAFYRFGEGQAVASIGAQCCHWEAMMATYMNKTQFYLEDIDTTYFNERQARFAWDYYARLTGKTMPPYTLVLGDEKQTRLPDGIFDKIIIINSFHEFNEKGLMLQDISKKLKPGGLLYVDEIIARRSGEKHGGCHKTLLTETEMKNAMQENGFAYRDGMYVTYRKAIPYRKIYVFGKR